MTLATRLNGVLAVVGTIPSGVGPDLLCGELRTDDDQPWRYVKDLHEGSDSPYWSGIRVAPNTVRGLALILHGLRGVSYGRGVDGKRKASA